MLNNLLTAKEAPSRDSPIPNFTYRAGNVNIIIYNFVYMLTRCFIKDSDALWNNSFFKSKSNKELTDMYNQLNLALAGWNKRINDPEKNGTAPPYEKTDST